MASLQASYCLSPGISWSMLLAHHPSLRPGKKKGPAPTACRTALQNRSTLAAARHCPAFFCLFFSFLFLSFFQTLPNDAGSICRTSERCAAKKRHCPARTPGLRKTTTPAQNAWGAAMTTIAREPGLRRNLHAVPDRTERVRDSHDSHVYGALGLQGRPSSPRPHRTHAGQP